MQIKRILFVILSFMLAISLSIVPMPHWANWLRPSWVILVLCYWILMYPDYINVGVAWILGLLQDALYGTILGEHALAMVLVAYIMYRSRRYLRHYPVLHQAFFIIFCCFIYNFMLFVIQWSLGEGIYDWHFWISPLFSIILWPLCFTVLRKLQYKFRIA